MNSKYIDNNINGNQFWKSHVKAVPGRPSRHREVKSNKHHKATPASEFQDFQEKVSDAWEINEDELLCVSDSESSFVVIQKNCNVTKSKIERDVTTFKKQNKRSTKIPVQPQTHNTVSTNSGNSAIINSSDGFIGRSGKFQMLLTSSFVNLEELRRLSWSGVPPEFRPTVWRLLTGYVPANLEKQKQVLERKRSDYQNLIKQYYDRSKWDDSQNVTHRQIHIDIPRMSQLITLFKQKTVQEMFERILFIWATRHPASGYVQGINDLVTPFFVIFLKEALASDDDLVELEMDSLPKETQNAIEADSFWCFSKFLESVQDNYTFAQLGVQRKITKLKELINRIDKNLHKHLQDNGIDYIQFSYRWMNNFLTRELSLQCTIRLWDTYLAEVDSFASFHDYICAAFLEHWRKQLLKEKDFQGLMLTLQNLPTKNWTDTEIEILVAEAYKLKYSFDDAPRHLVNVDSS